MPSPLGSSVEIEGSWIAHGFPCDGSQDLQLSLRQREKLLIARFAAESECAPSGALLWQGELPDEMLESDDLPLTLQVDLELPMAREAEVTLLSANRMVLVVDETTVALERGTLQTSPVEDGGGGRGGSSSPMDGSMPQPPGAGSSGEMSAKPGGAGGSDAAGRVAAGGGGRGGADASNSGGSAAPPAGTGGSASPRAGTGGSATSNGGAGASGSGGRGGAPAAGSGGAGGSGGRPPAAGRGGSAAMPPPDDADPGTPPPPDITGRRWDCINLLISCSCIAFPDDEVGGGVCRTKYPCCYSKLVDDNDNPDCLCEPEQAGGGCPDHGSSSSWRPVDWCPGQSE